MNVGIRTDDTAAVVPSASVTIVRPALSNVCV